MRRFNENLVVGELGLDTIGGLDDDEDAGTQRPKAQPGGSSFKMNSQTMWAASRHVSCVELMKMLS